jgi:hypothetical protein
MANWQLQGDYFEACNCDAACPCVFLSPPTTGDCTVLVAYHIDRGNFGDTKLDGLNAALAIHSPGHMMQVKWRAALYLDSSASKVQAEALGQIFGGKSGGTPAGMAPFIGEMLGVRNLPISYEIAGKQRRMKVSNVAAMEVEEMEGAGGNRISIEHSPLLEPLAYVAKSKKLSYADHGMNWEISDKNSFYAPISWKGP